MDKKKILIFEDNLIWSARLHMALTALGHDAEVIQSLPEFIPKANAAIINLSSKTLPPETLLPLLHEKGVYVIGHAGHKEEGLLLHGKEVGCDCIVSNSILTYKIDEVIAQIPSV